MGVKIHGRLIPAEDTVAEGSETAADTPKPSKEGLRIDILLETITGGLKKVLSPFTQPKEHEAIDQVFAEVAREDAELEEAKHPKESTFTAHQPDADEATEHIKHARTGNARAHRATQQLSIEKPRA